MAFVDEPYRPRPIGNERPFYSVSAVTFEISVLGHIRNVMTEIAQGRYWHTTEAMKYGVPVLHSAFVPGADRSELHAAMTGLCDTRNRVAHHESVFDQNPENVRRSIIYVARHLSPDLQLLYQAYVWGRRPT